jgi:FdhD protein
MSNPAEHPGFASWPVHRLQNGSFRCEEDEIAAEAPLTIRVNGDEFATLVCSPFELEELVIGFLASEGVIRSIDELKQISISSDGQFAEVQLIRASVPDKSYYAKRMISSCCGKSRQFYFYNDARTAKTITSRRTITVERCLALMHRLESSSDIFMRTGGLHNAALCGSDDSFIVRSDIGRHNALDKLYGYCLQNRVPVADKVVAFSGRLSSEVVLKAAKIGIGILLSRAAPTDLALKLATDLEVTAVGFIRGETMNIYTHPERITM